MNGRERDNGPSAKIVLLLCVYVLDYEYMPGYGETIIDLLLVYNRNLMFGMYIYTFCRHTWKHILILDLTIYVIQLMFLEIER